MQYKVVEYTYGTYCTVGIAGILIKIDFPALGKYEVKICCMNIYKTNIYSVDISRKFDNN